VTLFVIIAAAVAMVAWGSAAIFDKLALDGMSGLSPFSAVLVRQVFAVVLIAAIGAFTGAREDLQRMDSSTYLYLGLSALLAAVIGQAAFYFAAEAGQMSKVVVFVASYPLVTVLLAWPVLSEPLTLPKVIGAVMVVAGLIILSVSRAVETA
jgi:transporter family protein